MESARGGIVCIGEGPKGRMEQTEIQEELE